MLDCVVSDDYAEGWRRMELYMSLLVVRCAMLFFDCSSKVVKMLETGNEVSITSCCLVKIVMGNNIEMRYGPIC